jgi:hypothetical protein
MGNDTQVAVEQHLVQVRSPQAKVTCGAKTRSGAPCKQHPMPNGRCRMHGGKSLGGLASPTFKHGRYSKYMPTRLAERYMQGLKDTELLSLRHELALLDIHIGDQIRHIDTGESTSMFYRLKQAYVDFAKATASNDTPSAQLALAQLGDIITQGIAEVEVWKDIYTAVEQRRKLAESERRRMVEMQQIITTEEAMSLMAAVVQVIREYVTDRTTLVSISNRLKELLSRNPVKPAA